MPYKNKEDKRKQQRRWRKLNPDKVQKSRRKYRDKIRSIVLSHYGNEGIRCVECGFSNRHALSLDHIHGDGWREREQLPQWCKGGYNFYNQLIKRGLPSGYQTLCFNCQAIKRYENREYGRNMRLLNYQLTLPEQLMLRPISSKRYNAKALIDSLNNFISTHNRMPKLKDFRANKNMPSYQTYHRRYGGLKNMRKVFKMEEKQ